MSDVTVGIDEASYRVTGMDSCEDAADLLVDSLGEAGCTVSEASATECDDGFSSAVDVTVSGVSFTVPLAEARDLDVTGKLAQAELRKYGVTIELEGWR